MHKFLFEIFKTDSRNMFLNQMLESKKINGKYTIDHPALIFVVSTTLWSLIHTVFYLIKPMLLSNPSSMWSGLSFLQSPPNHKIVFLPHLYQLLYCAPRPQSHPLSPISSTSHTSGTTFLSSPTDLAVCLHLSLSCSTCNTKWTWT